MMSEISLNILDVVQNSVTAGSLLTEIGIEADSMADILKITVSDNGRGMPSEIAARAADPFFTTSGKRKAGLGLPFFKMAAELSGGSFKTESSPCAGTKTTAVFGLGHIDRMPVGDIAETFMSLICLSPSADFILSYTVDKKNFIVDTREIRQTLGEVALSEPEVLLWVREFIDENIEAIGVRL